MYEVYERNKIVASLSCYPVILWVRFRKIM